MASIRAEEPFRSLPSTERILRSSPVSSLLKSYERKAVTEVVRDVLADYRAAIADGADAPTEELIAAEVSRRVTVEWVQAPRTVINATGVILHTNLGRAPLSEEALKAAMVASEYSDLELSLETGKRESRHNHVSRLLVALTGVQAAHVTVNNASAVLLALTALAKGKQVVVSRGQAVEIGGGFRVPLILKQSGARLIEVGTTNRTRLSDYADAITERTAAILHVHSSNFRLVGFTEEVPVTDLASLAHAQGFLLVDDNGSGSLLDTESFGLRHEPTPVESLEAGSDLVCFSGDKLLGGPQAGILLGRQDLIRKVAAHPLARAVRPDKLTLACLSATLLTYLRGKAAEELPVWRMIAETPESVSRRCERVAKQLADSGLEVELLAGESTIGGGSLPGETLPTTLVALAKSIDAASLRLAEPPVIGRTQEDRVVLDLRTVPEAKEKTLLQAIQNAKKRT